MFPAHTLTFLFADLRDYTSFVERHGDIAAAQLIADYRRLVRHEVAGTGGGEVKTEGDSFFVAFATARQALHCAIGILREAERLNAERPERPLRIGIGIHAGEPVPQGSEYVGSAVNVAARMAQQASAGELLVSEVVRGLLRTSGAPPMQEREGLVLKGVDDPPRIYSVAWQSAAQGAAEGVGVEALPVPRPPVVSLGPLRVPVALVVGVALVIVAGAVTLVVGTRVAPQPSVGANAEPSVPAAANPPPPPVKVGALLWRATLDGSGSELEPRYVVGDSDASDIRFRPGEVELVVLKAGGNTGTTFKRSAPRIFYAEMDLKVRPGSDVRFIWSMRRTEKAEHEVRLETQSEELWISYVNVGVKSDRISGRPTIAGLASGKVVTLGVLADGTAYVLFVDGRKVTEGVDGRLADVETPFGLALAGKEGAVSILDVRVYALADATR